MKKILSVFCILLLLISGCKGKAPTSTPEALSTPAPSADEITLAMHTPTTLNPLATTKDSNVLIFDLVYDSLVYVDKEMRPVPYLAESCVISADGKTISFTLRNGVLWHDGAAFTATDVEYTINAIRALGPASIYYSRIQGIERVTVRDMQHIDLHLSAPHVTLLNLLDFPIIPCHRSDLDTTMVGTGQYKFLEYAPQKNLILTRNDTWSLSTPPHISRVTVKFLEQPGDVTALVKIGEVTAVTTRVYNIGGLGIGDSMHIMKFPTLEYEFIGFNLATPLLASYRVRHAISHAINREEIISDVFLGYGRPACVPVPPSSYLYVGDDNDRKAFQPESATALLYEDGYADADSDGILSRVLDDTTTYTLRMRLLVNEDNQFRVKYCQRIVKQLAAVGIEVTLDAVPWEDYTAKIAAGQYEMYAGAYDFSADLSYDFMLGADAFLQTGYASEDMTAALAGLHTPKTDEEIKTAYARFQEIFTRDVPMAGICFLDGAFVYSAKLSGVEELASSKIYRNLNMWTKE